MSIFIEKICIRHARYIHKVVGENYLVFSYPYFLFTVQLYGAIINHKGRFLFTPMQNNSLIWTTENVFGAKGGRFDPWKTDHKGTHPPPKYIFRCIERKSTLLRVSYGRVEGTKK